MSRRYVAFTRSAALASALLSGCATNPGDAGTDGANTSGGDASGSTGAVTTGAGTSDGSSGASTGGGSTSTTGAASTSGEATTDASTGSDACAESVLTWENFGKPFMLSWCTGCHHSEAPNAKRACAPCGVNFDTHHGISDRAAQIELHVLDWAMYDGLKQMPPAAFIPEDELQLLREWLDCGAPGPQTGENGLVCPDPDTNVEGC